MNYIYFYKGKLPSHILNSINSVKKSDPNSVVFLCTDQTTKIENIEIIQLKNLNSDFIKYVKNLNYFKSNSNPLWETSLLRIFYLLRAAEYLEIENFVHFDSDVILYKSFNEVKNEFLQNKLNITPLNELFLIFGYSFIGSLNNYRLINESCIRILEKITDYESKYYENKKINEMLLLNLAYIENPEYFNILNTLPSNNSKFVFDPVSYGQYFSGIDKKILSKKTIDENHYVGRALLKEGFKLKIIKQQPILETQNKKYELVNLHVHGKNLEKFEPR